MSFFPTNFEIPKPTNNFLRKFEQGKTRIKFLMEPVLGWVSKQYDENDKTAKPIVDYWKYADTQKQPNPKASLFLGCIVWNFELQAVQYLELTTKSLIEYLFKLEKEGYKLLTTDVVIERVGTKKEDTKYSLLTTPEQKKADFAEDLEKLKPDLEKVFIDGNPFGEASEAPTQKVRTTQFNEPPAVEDIEIDADNINVNMPF